MTIAADFYKTDGTPSTLSISKLVGGVTTTSTGSFAATNLPINGTLVITANTASTGTVNWANITSVGGSVTIASSFDIRDGVTTGIYTRVGVAASPADMKQFVIPRVRNTTTGQDTAFAVVNTGTTSASTTVTLKDAAGTVLATKVLTLAAKNQTALFTTQFFGLTNEASGTNYSFLDFTSTTSQFAGLALSFEGATATSLPVDRLQ